MENRPQITVQTLKYDGTPHRSWKAEIVEQSDDLLVLLGVFDREITHPDLGVIMAGTISYEYYWLDRWYNVFRFHEPDGRFRNFYCNVNMPPKFENGRLEYVDLDIDILVSGDFKIEILDEEEFNENCVRYNYPLEIITRAHATVEEIVGSIDARKFPFESGSNGLEFKL